LVEKNFRARLGFAVDVAAVPANPGVHCNEMIVDEVNIFEEKEGAADAAVVYGGRKEILVVLPKK
jgi:hypothetical protein